MERQARMTRRMKLLLAGGAIGLAVFVLLGLRGEARLVELVEVAEAPLAVTTQEEGKTRLRDRYLVSAPVAGVLRRVALEQGDAVVAGTIVAELEPAVSGLLDPASRARLEAESRGAADVQQAARQRVRAAQAAQSLARAERERLEAMPSGSVVSKSQLDAVRARALQADAELAAARAEERASAERATAARAILGQQGERGGPLTLPLPAPVDGVLIRRFQESSAPVAAGQALLEFGDPAALEIEVEALSTEAVRLRPGMRARVLRWGGEGELEARVARIEPGGFTKISALGVEEQRVRVILDFTSPREAWTGLGDGFRVEVEFLVWEGERVLQVPSSALFRAEGGWAVFVEDGGKARRVPVQIGARGGLATEIRAGLVAGQRVVSHPDDRIAEGVRLRSLD
jgi:HlyD family secretion protein